METNNQIARRRLDESWDKMVKIQARELPASELDRERFEKARRRSNVAANHRYRHTEKGRISQARHARKYFENHREQCQGYVIKYKAAFKEKYGVIFTAWNYWRKKLLDGRCEEKDVPRQYSAILRDWKARQDLNNRCTDEH